jgi:hypothetical protein
MNGMIRGSIMCPGCHKDIAAESAVEVYDDCGIYAGRWCSRDCAERVLNLHMSAQDYADAGECLEDD